MNEETQEKLQEILMCLCRVGNIEPADVFEFMKDNIVTGMVDSGCTEKMFEQILSEMKASFMEKKYKS